ncbi:uncharacterized protein BcabD6B2_01520 [Babesia caballi]|uniref:Uncharacterized protein n=1 Tax=Babesia caballi TaxID=5871 RepID=A0AAV4LMF9_BABCB|nr:hypothetical protein, conserved [Babesia caballi]
MLFSRVVQLEMQAADLGDLKSSAHEVAVEDGQQRHYEKHDARCYFGFNHEARSERGLDEFAAVVVVGPLNDGLHAVLLLLVAPVHRGAVNDVGIHRTDVGDTLKHKQLTLLGRNQVPLQQAEVNHNAANHRHRDGNGDRVAHRRKLCEKLQESEEGAQTKVNQVEINVHQIGGQEGEKLTDGFLHSDNRRTLEKERVEGKIVQINGADNACHGRERDSKENEAHEQ